MRAIYAKFTTVLDKSVADDFFVVALSAAMTILAQCLGIIPS